MDDYQVDIILYVFLFGVCPVIAVFGIIANIINIVIFVRNGFAEAINVSLLGLAISDLLALIFTVPFVVFINPHFLYSDDLQLDAIDFGFIALAIPNSAFSRVTCLITVFITVERCLCFVVPLRVKTLITPTRSAFVVMFIFVFMLLTLCLAYLSVRLDWRWDSSRNRSIIGTVYARSDSEKLLQIRTVINVSCQLFSLFALVTSNIALAISVNRQAKWRGGAIGPVLQPNPTTADSRGPIIHPTTYRNRRLARLIQFLSLILFVTYLISTLIYLVSLVEPAFSIYGKYMNEYRSSWMIGMVAQALNSSVNIIFYYRMNTKYRNTFNKILRKGAARVGIFPADHNTIDNTVVLRSHRSTPR